MRTFKTPSGVCFIDTNEIAAIKSYWFNNRYKDRGSLILLKGGGEIKVFDIPEDVKEKMNEVRS